MVCAYVLGVYWVCIGCVFVHINTHAHAILPTHTHTYPHILYPHRYLRKKLTHLACFLPGNIALGVMVGAVTVCVYSDVCDVCVLMCVCM